MHIFYLCQHIYKCLRYRPVRRGSRLSGGVDSTEDVPCGEEVYL